MKGNVKLKKNYGIILSRILSYFYFISGVDPKYWDLTPKNNTEIVTIFKYIGLGQIEDLKRYPHISYDDVTLMHERANNLLKSYFNIIGSHISQFHEENDKLLRLMQIENGRVKSKPGYLRESIPDSELKYSKQTLQKLEQLTRSDRDIMSLMNYGMPGTPTEVNKAFTTSNHFYFLKEWKEKC